MARTWRTEPVRWAGGASWRLISGRALDRIRVGLGVVVEIEAERALANMRHLEQTGDADRLLAIYARDPEAARTILLGDPGEGSLLPEPEVDHGALTVAEYWERFYWPVRKDKASPIGVSERTWKEEERYWKHTGRMPHRQQGERPKRGILDGPIGVALMRELDDQIWERWQSAQTHLSPRSKAIRRNAYSALLSYARRMGHSTFRPEFFRLKGATKRTRPQSDPLTLDEVLALLEAAAPMHRAMWAVGAGQGLRPSELVAMHWEDIDWAARTMLVRGTKTAASWDAIPLTPLTFRELRLYWVAIGQPIEGRCFLRNGFGSRGRSPAGRVKKAYQPPKPFKSYRRALATDAREAGIQRKVTPYLLRHSFATIAFLLGVEKDVTRRVGRWVNSRILDQVYTRPRPADLVAKIARFDVG